MSEQAKVLIIDDDHFILKMTTLMLEKSGYDVRVADNWRYGMELCMEWHPDVVLLDLMLPERSGWDILDEIKAKKEYTVPPILIFTATDTPSMDEEAKQHGALGLIQKPFGKTQLIDIIEKALSSR